MKTKIEYTISIGFAASIAVAAIALFMDYVEFMISIL